MRRRTILPLLLLMGAFGLCLSGCQMVERAFVQTMENVRELPDEAPTPGFEGMISNFLYTLLIGATGGAGLYGGVIRPRRIAKETIKPDDETQSSESLESLVKALREMVDGQDKAIK